MNLCIETERIKNIFSILFNWSKILIQKPNLFRKDWRGEVVKNQDTTTKVLLNKLAKRRKSTP